MEISPCTTIIEYEGKAAYLDLFDKLLSYPCLLLGGRKFEYIDASQFVLDNDVTIFREKIDYPEVLDYLVALVITVVFYPIVLMATLIKSCSSENDSSIRKLELFETQSAAAIRIQAVARGFLERRRQVLNRQTEAATKIQAVVRGFLVRNKLKKEREAGESIIGKYIYQPIAREVNNVIQDPKPMICKSLKFLAYFAAKEAFKALIYMR